MTYLISSLRVRYQYWEFSSVFQKKEQMMVEAFDDEYKTYRQRTGRFFPKFKKEQAYV